MALIGAGTCCRFIMIGKVTGGAKLKTLGDLNSLRSDIAHKVSCDLTGESQKEVVSYGSSKTDETIVELSKEARGLGLELDVKSYIAKEKPTPEHESPRGYAK